MAACAGATEACRPPPDAMEALQPPSEVEQIDPPQADKDMMQLSLLPQFYVEAAEPSCDVQEVDEEYEEIVQLAVGQDPLSRYCLTGSEAWNAWADEWYFQTDEPDHDDDEMAELAAAWEDWTHEFFFETDEGEYLDVWEEDWDVEFANLDREPGDEECSEVVEEKTCNEVGDEGDMLVEDPVE